MEFFRFCLEIIQREAARLNVGIKMSTVNQLTAANADDVNYDNGHNRCAFLYRCGTINLSFAKDCFSKFLLDFNGIEYLMSKWKLYSKLSFCSLSKGPALDYIALLLSHEQCRTLTSLIGSVKIITKHGAWRNTTNIVQEIINKESFQNLPPSIGNIEVIQGDPLKNFTEKVKLPINDSDVVMMIRTLNLQSSGYNQEEISKAIQDILDALKPGAVLFCIDTKPSVKEIIHLLPIFPGKFLLEPISVNTMINLEYTDMYKAHFGCIPVVSGRGSFFVWEKSLVTSPKVKYELNKISEAVKHTTTITDKVVAEGFSAKVSCKSPLSQETNSCNQYLAEHFSSCIASKLDEENGITDVFDHGSKNLQFSDNVNRYFQKSNYTLSSDSLINGSMPVQDQFKEGSLNISLSSLRSELDAISNDICLQTEPEEFANRTEVNKIIELTNKITDLTLEVTNLLENNTSKHCDSDDCCKNSEEISNPSDINLDNQNLRECFCCQKYAHQQSCLSSCHNCSNASICGATSNTCVPSNGVRSKSLVENTSQPVAQLVIPLTNLSTDTVTQIISLIAQSNQQSEK